MTRQLKIESLESRSLCAIAAFTVNLYEDAGGAPGQLITNDAVQIGDTFFVEIMAREYDPLAAGLRGVALDIAWDPTVLKEIDVPFEPNDPSGTLITPHLPLFRSSKLNNDAGTIDNLSGTAFLSSGAGRAIGNLASERFSLLRFQALQTAEASPFTLDQGRSRIATVPVSNLGDANLYFEPQTITVVGKSDAELVGPRPADEYFRTFETAAAVESPCHGELV